MSYADIILPVPLDCLFTYIIPDSQSSEVLPGTRVLVPFGKTRKIGGVVLRVHNVKPETGNLKAIEQILDTEGPSVTELQLKLMQWMWEYHICSPGDVLKAALPGGLRPDSSTSVPVYRPRTESFVRLGPAVNGKDLKYTSLLFDSRCRRQKEVFDRYLSLSGLHRNPASPKAVTKKHLIEASSGTAALKSLIEKRMLEIYEIEIGRLPSSDGIKAEPAVLSDAQQLAIDGIRKSFTEKNVCLLHGVTSCGKTEIYIHLIKEQMAKGRQVLYLLPEIALTTQIMHRLARLFGDEMCCYHSGCADSIRAEIWKRQCGDNPYRLVLATRSGVMLPFRNLGLIIVDEEHEPSYKQEDPAPRYHGRNTAIMLASLCGAKVLLGSATPSLESYCNATGGKYGLVELSERFGNVALPAIETVDTADLMKRRYMQGLFSPRLIECMDHALKNGQQSILFLNRRGFSNVVECPDCGWIQKCDCCDVSLTFHKTAGTANCHYCGRSYRIPDRCPGCGGTHLHGRGYGTQRVEEDLRRLFPEARVARLDLDSARHGYESILTDFQEGRTDILIGTQMLSKGLDFDNVQVVGILQADSLMSYPDFRSGERAYQLMAQVAGRAGRRLEQGHVILQTRQPDSELLNYVTTGNYASFYASQMHERSLFSYPPYSRLVYVSLKGKDENVVSTAAISLCRSLSEIMGNERILGPDAPQVSRIHNLHIRRILIKAPLSIGIRELRKKMTDCMNGCRLLLKGVSVSFDVDPQ